MTSLKIDHISYALTLDPERRILTDAAIVIEGRHDHGRGEVGRLGSSVGRSGD